MADYKSMYAKLFNTITDTIESLKAAQIETEEMFLSSDEPNVTVLNQPDDK